MWLNICGCRYFIDLTGDMEGPSDFIIISGNSHPELAKDVAGYAKNILMQDFMSHGLCIIIIFGFNPQATWFEAGKL